MKIDVLRNTILIFLDSSIKKWFTLDTNNKI